MFGLKIGVALVIVFVLMSLVKFTLRKIFKIDKEKKNCFSYNHINKTHQKVDWFVRIGTAIGLVTVLYLTLYKEYPAALFLALLILFTILDYSVRIYFEWRYSDSPKQSILTLGEMIVLVTSIIAILQFDLLNLAY